MAYVPKAIGEPHPEGNEYWRRYHMVLMNHDRDLTVRDDEREIGASLAQCFECHTVNDAAGTPVTYQDERHFCRACHEFTAVRVDCFMCHRSTPDGVDESPGHAGLAPQEPLFAADIQGVIAYLQQHGIESPEPAEAGQ